MISIRLNIFFLNCWLFKKLINVNQSKSKAIVNNFLVNKKVNNLIKNKFVYYYSDLKDKYILDELQRNYRTIQFGLNDLYFKDNFMNRNIETIIKEYIFVFYF